ncbi:hypothetical protein PR048_003685 [Dryococelus australis]|uniref:Ig-like domain-containing protein n=1 Tax=Dryococelus australis TaxID=614101 RepID=A0ABQ9INQ5_9NEOP|nr:hypothetical protein PR048_003685 [Dryococelus australis]
MLYFTRPGKSAPINEDLIIVCPNHLRFSQKGRDFASGQQPMEKRRRLGAGRCHPAPSFRPCSILASITLIGPQDLAVKEPPKYFHSLNYRATDLKRTRCTFLPSNSYPITRDLRNSRSRHFHRLLVLRPYPSRSLSINKRILNYRLSRAELDEWSSRVHFEDTLYEYPLASIFARGLKPMRNGIATRDYSAEYLCSVQGAVPWQYEKSNWRVHSFSIIPEADKDGGSRRPDIPIFSDFGPMVRRQNTPPTDYTALYRLRSPHDRRFLRTEVEDCRIREVPRRKENRRANAGMVPNSLPLLLSATCSVSNDIIFDETLKLGSQPSVISVSRTSLSRQSFVGFFRLSVESDSQQSVLRRSVWPGNVHGVVDSGACRLCAVLALTVSVTPPPEPEGVWAPGEWGGPGLLDVHSEQQEDDEGPLLPPANTPPYTDRWAWEQSRNARGRETGDPREKPRRPASPTCLKSRRHPGRESNLVSLGRIRVV